MCVCFKQLWVLQQILSPHGRFVKGFFHFISSSLFTVSFYQNKRFPPEPLQAFQPWPVAQSLQPYFVFPGNGNGNSRRVIANVISSATLHVKREDRRRRERAAIGFAGPLRCVGGLLPQSVLVTAKNPGWALPKATLLCQPPPLPPPSSLSRSWITASMQTWWVASEAVL